MILKKIKPANPIDINSNNSIRTLNTNSAFEPVTILASLNFV
jgi:hypothetical protein